MKKVLLSCIALLTIFFGGANSVQAISLGEEITSLSGITNGTMFIISNGTKAKYFYGTGSGNGENENKNAELASIPAGSYFYFTLEKYTDGDIPNTTSPADNIYRIKITNADGEGYPYGTDNGYYLNAVRTYADVVISAAEAGWDGAKKDALWYVTYDGEKGFSFQNVYRKDNGGKSWLAIDNNFEADQQYLKLYSKPNDSSVSIEISNNLEEIPQIQDQKEDDTFTLATPETVDGVTTYTTKDGLSFIFKILNKDVTGCDYITFEFAEPTPSGLKYSFWEGQDMADFPAGITEFKYVFADDPNCKIKDGIIPQITLFTWFGNANKVVKVKGVYKHKVSEIASTRTYSFDKALDFTDVEGLEAYVISAFDAETATLTLTQVTKVPANTGLYLVGADGDYEIPVIESADAIASNLLVASGDGTVTTTTDDKTNLVLAGTGANRGFHPLSADGNMGENKAYLQLPTTDFKSIASARLNLVFEGEATAITKVNDVMTGNSAWYTVSGMKLNAKPTQKGIYVNNGKKFAVQ